MLLTATPASRIALVKEAALCHEGVGAQAASGVGPQPAGPLSLSHQLAQQLQSPRGTVLLAAAAAAAGWDKISCAQTGMLFLVFCQGKDK